MELDAVQSSGATITTDVTVEFQRHVKKYRYLKEVKLKIEKEYTPEPKLQVQENDSE